MASFPAKAGAESATTLATAKNRRRN